jgi:molecular chaperone HscB
VPDPFDTLGLEPRFGLDLKALEHRHRELSKALHPDKHTASAPGERRMALSRAIDVNEAFRTLKDPIKRAEAMLARSGVAVSETNEQKVPPALLMEMMESREELADARRSKDAARVASLGGAMKTRRDHVISVLAAVLDDPARKDDHARDALPALAELRYLRRFLDEVSAIEEELFG